ncbi:MAG: nuclear transport factor 2 family protein [Dehalococcoidia bacterium]
MTTNAQANAISVETATRIVNGVEEAFGAADIERIMLGFTDDAVAIFATLPPMNGRAEIERFIRARFRRQRNYRLTKQLRMAQGEMIGNVWEGSWDDAESGRRVVGRGVEFWTMRGEQIARWEAAFNVLEEGADAAAALGIL